MIRNTDWPTDMASNEAAASPTRKNSPLSSDEEVCHPRKLHDAPRAIPKGSLRSKMIECAAAAQAPVAHKTIPSPLLRRGKRCHTTEEDFISLMPESNIYRGVMETFNDSGLKSTGSADSGFLRWYQESLDSLALSSDEDEDDLVQPKIESEFVRWNRIKEGESVNQARTLPPIAPEEIARSLTNGVSELKLTHATSSQAEVKTERLKDSSSRPGRSPKRRTRRLETDSISDSLPSMPLVKTEEETGDKTSFRSTSRDRRKKDLSPPRHPGPSRAQHLSLSPKREHIPQHPSAGSPKVSSSISQSSSSISNVSKHQSCTSEQAENSCSIQSSLTSLPTCDSVRSSNVSLPSMNTPSADDASVVDYREQFLAQHAGDNESMASMPSLSSIHLDDSSHHNARFRSSVSSLCSSGHASLDSSHHTQAGHYQRSPKKLPKSFSFSLDTSRQGIRRETLSPVVFQVSKKRLDWDRMQNLNTSKDAPPNLIARPLSDSLHEMMLSDDALNSPLYSPKPSMPVESAAISTPLTRNTKKTIATEDRKLPPPRQDSLRESFQTNHASGDSPPRVARRRLSNDTS